MTAPAPAPGDYHAVHLTEDLVRPLVWRVVADHLASWVPPSAHVLEIGAGYCAWINAVRAARRVAVDRWAELPRHAAPGVEPVVRDLRELRSLGESRFDVVLASNVLEHFEPDAAARVVDDVRFVLRPGGRMLIVQPNFRLAYRRYFDDYTHRSIFTDVSLPALLRAHNFYVLEVRPRFLPYSMQGTRLPVSRLTVNLYLRSPVKPGAGQMLVIAERR